jgi:uncharacterized linocin/CFP29 family protein
MDRTVSVDILSPNGSGGLVGQGPLAQRLLANGMNIAALRTNDVLRYRDWIAVDERVVTVARQRLVGVNDLFAAGLSYGVSDALGVTRLEWERISDFGDAEVSMSGLSQGRNDRVQFDMNFVPLPIVHKDFNINIRALAASRRNNHPLDLTQVDLASRIVAEKVESMLFTGGPALGTLAGTVYGYTNAPGRLTASLGHDWTSGVTTGENMLGDLLGVIEDLQAAPNRMFGPYMVYVPDAAFTNMSADYKANSDRTILERLKAIPGIRDIKPSTNLTAGIVVVQFTSDIVDMVDGIQPTAVQWESQGGMVQNFKVMCILVPRMKETYTSQSGIAYYTF